ncbi:MAG: cytochrome b [Wenzhouxiangella sp.]
MRLTNTASRYGLISQFFHWAVVALLLFQYTWAWRIDNAEGFRLRLELVTQHKTIGMVVLGLAILRLVWRLFNRPPPMPAAMRGWERLAALAGHWLLYLLIFAVPLTGWLYSSAAGLGDLWWGPVNFPSLVGDSERLEEIFERLHQACAISLGVMTGVHVLAALRHQFWIKDGLMKRMLPSWSKDS